ncbi:MAG: Amuc_1099 family pilus-like system protein, partial [bacterium]
MASSLFEWIRNSFDRLIAVLALGVLVAALFVLGTMAQSLRFRQADDSRQMDALKASHPDVTPVEKTPFEKILAALQTPDQVGVWSNRMFAPEPRIRCINCERPIPLQAIKCPYCQAGQPNDVPSIDKDSDHDGMPDEWEKRFHLNALDPDDAKGDPDHDGFSNLEECKAGTDPTSLKSHPAWVGKLVVQAITPKPFNLVFRGVNKIGVEQLLFQINLRNGGRTYWKRLGEDVEGFKLVSFDEQGAKGKPTLTIQRGDKRIPLIRDEPVPHNEYELELLFVVDGHVYKVGVPSKITIRDDVYEVKEVDSNGGRVLIHDPTS